MSTTQFDMPHALVTLTDVEGNVEIEVWPKAGQSAYVVVPPPIARAIAEHLVHMADAAEAMAAAPDTEGLAEDDAGPAPGNVVSLAARRKRPDP
jgi:hypothetical protein